jgi:long-chain-fatty-acid--CoA ligase ACSBG
VAKGFIKLGLKPFHAVAISGFNGPEWNISALGAMFAGGFSCGLYPTNNAETNKHIMSDSETNSLVVEDDATLKKMLQVSEDIPSLVKIIQYSGKPSHPGVVSWKELMDLGSSDKSEDAETDLNERIANMYVNQCCVLIYTSGTTGNPKGVMLSHDNILFTCQTGMSMMPWKHEHIISYLPLSHIAALMVDVFFAINSNSTVYFADKMALKGSLLDTLQEIRPTIFFGVPRVWEKIQEGMQYIIH